MNKKTTYSSIPYRSLARWSVETKGRGWDGSDLKIWVGSALEPLVSLELQTEESSQAIMTLLSQHAL